MLVPDLFYPNAPYRRGRYRGPRGWSGRPAGGEWWQSAPRERCATSSAARCSQARDDWSGRQGVAFCRSGGLGAGIARMRADRHDRGKRRRPEGKRPFVTGEPVLGRRMLVVMGEQFGALGQLLRLTPHHLRRLRTHPPGEADEGRPLLDMADGPADEILVGHLEQ